MNNIDEDKNYYEEKIKEIQQYLDSNDIDKAMKALQEELSMPYIPKKYESQLQEQYMALVEKFQKESNVDKTIDAQTLIEYLNDENPMKQAIALDALNKVNLRQVANELKQWVETNEDEFSKAAHVVIIEALMSQKVDIKINLGDKVIDCLKDESLFDNSNVTVLSEKISEKTIKEPQLDRVAQQVMQSYLIASYPNAPLDNEIDKVCDTLLEVAKFMMGEMSDGISKEAEDIFNKIKDYF